MWGHRLYATALRKAENTFWLRPFTEQFPVTPADREPKYQSVCKALVCSNQTWISWEALLLGAGNRSATAVWRHIKPPCVCQPSAQCIAWFPFLHHLTTHLPPHPPSKGYLPTYTTAPLSKQIQWNALFHSGFNDAWDSKEPALFRTHNSTLY